MTDRMDARATTIRARRLAVLGATLLGAMGAAAPAVAGIGTSGPVNERNGFLPEYYEDQAGLRLQLCLDGPHCFATAERPSADRPPAFPNNFPVEAFWWAAETELATAGGSVQLVLAQEAAFAGGFVIDGGQAAFGRLRIRGDGLVGGQWYRFTTPYGQFDERADTGGGRQINFTSDIGCGIEGLPPICPDVGFGALGASVIGPNFLTWDASPPAPPEGYVADGVSNHSVTGSTFVPTTESINPPVAEGEEPAPENTTPANYFRVDRISADGGEVVAHVGQTGQFLVQGRLADDPPRPHLLATIGDAGDQPIAAGPKAHAVTVRNGGSGDLRIASVAVAGSSPDFAVTATDCVDATIAPAGATTTPTGAGQTCTVQLAFDPSAVGYRGGTLQITEHGGGVHDVLLRGNATQPVMTINPASVAFASRLVGTSAPPQTITVGNIGGAPLRVTGASIGGAAPADFAIGANACAGATLSAGASCRIELHFTPAAGGVRNATLDLVGPGAARSVQLRGVGNDVPAGAGGGGAPGVPATLAPSIGSSLGAAAAGVARPRLRLHGLATSRRVKRTRARRSGIRLVMRLSRGTDVVRIRVLRRTASGRRLLSDGYKRPPRSGLYRVRQRHAALRRSFGRPGTYEVEVTPGRSRTELGATRRVRLRIVR